MNTEISDDMVIKALVNFNDIRTITSKNNFSIISVVDEGIGITTVRFTGIKEIAVMRGDLA